MSDRVVSESSSHVKSAERTLDVLELLAARLRPVPTSVIASSCKIPKSSCYHLLNVMHDRGWVTYYETECAWGLGVAALETGWAYSRSAPLQRLAQPILVELAADVRATAHLAVLQGQDVRYLQKEEPDEAVVHLVTRPGLKLPAHLTSVGRAILAAMSDYQVRVLYQDSVVVQRTGRGPRTVTELLKELSLVRRAGYALEAGLTSPGISCAAAAVMSHDLIPVGAVGVTFVTAERSPDEVEELTSKVCAATHRIGCALGLRRPEIKDDEDSEALEGYPAREPVG